MPSLRDIKEHRQSVQSIAKVTKALDVVSRAKSHRLQSRIEQTRAFASHSWELLEHLAATVAEETLRDPALTGHESVNRIALLLVSSDKGMAGPYDDNVIALASRFLDQSDVPVDLITIGRVGREAMLRRGHPIHADFPDLNEDSDLEDLTPVARILLEGFHSREFDQVALAYTEFQPGSRLMPSVKQLLPVTDVEAIRPRSYIYEPNPNELLRSLLPRIVRFQVYEAFIESLAAENTSRARAMSAATQNANELIRHLDLSYNKERQRAITEEINDILGGSSALGSHRI